MAKDKTENITFPDMNNDKLVDVNCGRMMPSSNLNSAQPGSYASMRKELDNAYKTANSFYASTSNGFTPGFTTKGLEGNWGFMSGTTK